MRKLTLKLCSLLLLVLFSVVVLGCNKTEPITIPETITPTINTPTPTPTPEPSKEKTPIVIDDIFDIHTEAQKEYL